MHLFFDLDNTLWDFDANSQHVLAELFLQHDLNTKLNTNFEAFYLKYHQINDELWHLYYFKKIEKSELRYKRFYDAFLYFKYDDLTLSKIMAEDYLKKAPYKNKLKPGCIEILEHFGEKYEMHIITNGFTEVQNIKLDNCGLRKYFSQIIISEEHGSTKPHPEIFQLAETLAKTTSDKCIMIGDNWISDIEGAIGAGWKAVYYNYKNTVHSYVGAKSIAHLSELITLLK